MEGLSPFVVHLKLSQCCLLTGSDGDLVTKLCLTLATPQTVAFCQAPLSIGFSRPRVLEWVTIFFSGGSSRLRYQAWVNSATWEAPIQNIKLKKKSSPCKRTDERIQQSSNTKLTHRNMLHFFTQRNIRKRKFF